MKRRGPFTNRNSSTAKPETICRPITMEQDLTGIQLQDQQFVVHMFLVGDKEMLSLAPSAQHGRQHIGNGDKRALPRA